MTSPTQPVLPTSRKVCVWFGGHLIADYISDPESAASYEAAMRRRFLSLRVTNEPASTVVPDADLS
ncbi:hypothetical protein AB0P21_18695 [Kribbella sp. NPDC056861]|uniref:hypothetical protein n=1 Tax=Kribbella sp. NPDC056861 TaxID=3154857 RepID=UPI00344A5DA9